MYIHYNEYMATTTPIDKQLHINDSYIRYDWSHAIWIYCHLGDGGGEGVVQNCAHHGWLPLHLQRDQVRQTPRKILRGAEQWGSFDLAKQRRFVID